MSIILEKQDPNCSNIVLIDDSKCVGHSLDIIQSNMMNLTGTLSNLSQYVDQWNMMTTYFNTISTDMVNAMYNIILINDKIQEPYSVVKSLSSNWNQQFSIFYPQIFDIQEWLVNQPTYETSIAVWLNNNFPTNEYAADQKINVYVSFYYNFYFQFYIQKTFNETCITSGGTITVSCVAPSDNRYQQCNITGHGCSNAYSHCTSKTTTQSNSYTCENDSGAKLLTVSYIKDSHDRYFARVIPLTYKNVSNNWTKI